MIVEPPFVRDDPLAAIGYSLMEELESNGQVPTPSRFEFVTGDAFVLDQPEGIPAVWGVGSQVLWAEGEPLLLAGPIGTGKTTLATQLVYCSLGLLPASLLGFPVSPAERVLYLACDRHRQIARCFARLAVAEHREILRDRLVVWRGPPPRDLATNPRLLRQMAEDAGADRVIIDSLKDVALGLSADDVGAGMNQALQHCCAAGIDPCGTHHTRKPERGGAKSNKLDDVYGSTWVPAGAGSVLLLSGEPGDPLAELSHLKPPGEAVGPLSVEHDYSTGLSTVLVGPADPLDVLREAGGPLSTVEVAGRVHRRDADDKQKRRVRYALNRLVDRNLVLRRDGGGSGGDGGSDAALWVATDSRREAP